MMKVMQIMEPKESEKVTSYHIQNVISEILENPDDWSQLSGSSRKYTLQNLILNPQGIASKEQAFVNKQKMSKAHSQIKKNKFMSNSAVSNSLSREINQSSKEF